MKEAGAMPAFFVAVPFCVSLVVALPNVWQPILATDSVADSNSPGLASPPRKNKARDRLRKRRSNIGMEQSIRKLRPEVSAPVNLVLAFALVLACTVNVWLLATHL
jgi:hypothetical protein